MINLFMSEFYWSYFAVGLCLQFIYIGFPHSGTRSSRAYYIHSIKLVRSFSQVAIQSADLARRSGKKHPSVFAYKSFDFFVGCSNITLNILWSLQKPDIIFFFNELIRLRTKCSVMLSIADVASSSNSIWGLPYSARAKAINCCCPPDKFVLFSLIMVA